MSYLVGSYADSRILKSHGDFPGPSGSHHVNAWSGHITTISSCGIWSLYDSKIGWSYYDVAGPAWSYPDYGAPGGSA